MRAKGEVDVQHDTQDFRSSVQRSHSVINSHLRVSGDWWCRKRTVSRCISEKQWPVARNASNWWPPKRSIVGVPSPLPPRCWEQRPAARSRKCRTSCLSQELGSPTQSGGKGLGPTQSGRSREQWMISMRRRWETVSNAFEMSTAMTMVLLGGLRWLRPETTLEKIGSRAEAVECLSLRPSWEGHVPSASTMDGRS